MTLNEFLKYSRNIEIEINEFLVDSYDTYKKALSKTNIGASEVLSWDVCDYDDGSKLVGVSISEPFVEISTVKADMLYTLLGELNDIGSSASVREIEMLIKKIENNLPKSVWLNYDGSDRFEFRYKHGKNKFYIPVILV